jgi:ATP-dependent DNA helicase DinG
MKIRIEKAIPRDVGDLKYLLEEHGPLASLWPEFEARKEQQRMFLEVLRCFKQGDASIIEAGTGTGKTLAYLLPALLSGKKTMVSTGLKNLQEQILNKDLKFIRDFFDLDFKAVLLKGRDNYLCYKTFASIQRRFKREGSFAESYEAFKFLDDWVWRTVTGELNELPGYPGGVWGSFPRLSAVRESCEGHACPYGKECFVSKSRAGAAEADIVLVNHYLLLSDLALRGMGYSILPEFEAMVIDEAHLLEGAAVQSFTKSCPVEELMVSLENLSEHLNRVFKDIEKSPDLEARRQVAMITAVLEKAEERSLIIANNLQKLKTGEIFLWPREPEDSWPKANREYKTYLRNLLDPLQKLSSIASVIGDTDEEIKPLALRLKKFCEDLFFIYEGSDPSYVYQIVSSGKKVAFEAIPIVVGPYLSDNLFNKNKTIILTSATMAVNGKLDYFKKSVGISLEANPLILPSPFDFKNNTLLYLPRHLPCPAVDRGAFDEALIPELEKLLNITRGRALVLFTSFNTMRACHAVLSRKLRFKLFMQGEDYNKDELLRLFEAEKHSILLATKSFWQGVDVPGESLSAVIIDKLPFPNPKSPLTGGKMDFIESLKGNWFMDFFVPDATIQIKQGLGRLVRAKTDKGLLAILDPRTTTKFYGPTILRSLPQSSRTQKIAEVESFFQRIGLN